MKTEGVSSPYRRGHVTSFFPNVKKESKLRGWKYFKGFFSSVALKLEFLRDTWV